ncbi:MAG: CPBP family intramembrane metalloprotease [Corynebacterium sp.]|uniref:CPBP family intramembrane glutamic endopeptidase n=1 Tax=Corynebacterium sp. TaxID=1720 RepID=UPI0026DA88F1|nr:CPBP family intramembrane glutamic endopeptidase [Corynebacterium sp.]MDO4761424.1 CPBP family intramembrane metalloprotease [Corynebacterium sp.]
MRTVPYFQRDDLRVVLKWWDIVILTVIFFGSAIVSSTMAFFSAAPDVGASVEDFDSAANYYALAIQSVQLLVGLVYLWLRRFDFRVWKLHPTLKGTVVAVLLFFFLGVLFDVAYWCVDVLSASVTPGPQGIGAQSVDGFAHVDFSLVVYSLFNGLYEELFFLGICVMVAPRWRMLAFVFSLVVRFSFHTYQGLVPAVFIGVIVGAVYFVVFNRSKDKNLYPFVLSHAFADIFGIGALTFFASF